MDGFAGVGRARGERDTRQDHAVPDGFDFPRLSQLLDKMNGPSQVAELHIKPLEPPVEDNATARSDGTESRESDVVVEETVEASRPQAAVVHEALAPINDMHEALLPIADVHEVLPSFEEVLRGGYGIDTGEPDGADEIEQMIEKMHLRDVAREALRARLIAIGEGRQHRSTYESVFIMLAFAVMVLLAAPPIVDILLAAHGVRPG